MNEEKNLLYEDVMKMTILGNQVQYWMREILQHVGVYEELEVLTEGIYVEIPTAIGEIIVVALVIIHKKFLLGYSFLEAMSFYEH